MAHIDYKDTEILRQQCLEGVQFGFTGKQIMHPNPIQVTQECAKISCVFFLCLLSKRIHLILFLVTFLYTYLRNF